MGYGVTMASINGNGEGARLVNWLMGIASAVVIGGIFALVAMSWNNNYTLGTMQGQLDRMEKSQMQRDAEQDKWIAYFLARLDGGRRKPSRQPEPDDGN